MLVDLAAIAPRNGRPGTYVKLIGRPNEPIDADKFSKSGLRLLTFSPGDDVEGSTGSLVFFASIEGHRKLRNKVEKFRDENTRTGRPKNADLVQSIGRLERAKLRSLWRGPSESFPTGDAIVEWEVWVQTSDAEAFEAAADSAGLSVAVDRLYFPEQIVLHVSATPSELRHLVVTSLGVDALAKPATTAGFFDNLETDEQDNWAEDLLRRTTFASEDDAHAYVTLLDTGVALGHPLLSDALSSADRHAADPAWALDDLNGHGTGMAGLSVFGDLTSILQSTGRVSVPHRIESVKVIPDAGINPHHLLGAVTKRAVNAVEARSERRRVFTLASSTPDDHPHDGAPTSWSSELDQLAAGCSGEADIRRLMIVSAGNVKAERHMSLNYHEICDGLDEEIESPGQAWNAITVGACTNKITLSADIRDAHPLAPSGDLSPFSKTASWSSTWPIKPDIVLEGGNLLFDGWPPAMACQDLSLLTTHNNYTVRHFSTFEATSAATALAARMAALIWSHYPDYWPETIRALLVSSARWTTRMLRHLPPNPAKTDYEKLFRRYGYGRPNLKRAYRSGSDAVTMVIQDTIVPYTHSMTRGAPAIHNHIKIHTLPWPVESLRRLGSQEVTLRIALSTFVEPNPAEAARGRKLRYGSHGLRFKLNRADESAEAFERRINAAASTDADDELIGISGDDDGWRFGARRRDVGSIHIDEIRCRASDLARRRFLAVHPVGGWWKSRLRQDDIPREARYSLVIDIDADGVEVDLYLEVEIAIAAMIAATTIVSV